MDAQKRVMNAVTIIDLQGRLDAHQGKKISAILADPAADGSRTVVNLSKVHFIDSTGLAILVKGMKHHREQAGDMILCELQQPVRIIFELTRLDRVFDIYPTEAAALQAMN
jgi:anti-sigma B factor antagonist